jgi:hypothetical protein
MWLGDLTRWRETEGDESPLLRLSSSEKNDEIKTQQKQSGPTGKCEYYPVLRIRIRPFFDPKDPGSRIIFSGSRIRIADPIAKN